MQINLDVNPAFAAWRSSTGPEKEQQLEKLVQLLKRYAKYICWERLSDHKDDFDQLVNGIIWRALKKADAFQGRAKFSTWFYRIAVNECNTFLRKHKERGEEPIIETACEPNLDARLDAIAILDKLSGDDYLLLKMVIEGESFAVIGEELGISANAATVRWNRLKGRLRRAIQF